MKNSKESHKEIWISLVLLFLLSITLISMLIVGAINLGYRALTTSFTVQELESKFKYYQTEAFYASGDFCEVNDDSRVVDGSIHYEALSGDFSFDLPENFRMVKGYDAWKTSGLEKINIAGQEWKSFGFNSYGGEGYQFIAESDYEKIDCMNYYSDSSVNPGVRFDSSTSFFTFYKGQTAQSVADSQFEYTDYILKNTDVIGGYNVYKAVEVEGKGGRWNILYRN